MPPPDSRGSRVTLDALLLMRSPNGEDGEPEPGVWRELFGVRGVPLPLPPFRGVRGVVLPNAILRPRDNIGEEAIAAIVATGLFLDVKSPRWGDPLKSVELNCARASFALLRNEEVPP